jgi:hypothetical protein
VTGGGAVCDSGAGQVWLSPLITAGASGRQVLGHLMTATGTTPVAPGASPAGASLARGS